MSESAMQGEHDDEAERGQRLRRANVRLAIVLGALAAILYLGFVMRGIL